MTEDSTSDRRSPRAEPSEPNYWNAPPCRLRIITDSDETWLDLPRPFALIGAHRCCDVQVGGSSSNPGVAYIVCCFANSVEVWPTAAIAFPRWGAIGPDEELLVGRSRITVHHPRVAENDASTEPFQTSDVAETTMTWPGKTITKTFRRPVTLIGENHPSVLRLHGRSLRRCHYAAVVEQQSLWIIDISCNDLASERRIQRLSKPGATTQIGDVIVELSSVTPVLQPILAPDFGELLLESTQPASAITERPTPVANASPEFARPAEATRQPPGADDREALATNLTNRMVSMMHSRASKKRPIMLAAMTMGFSVAGLVLSVFLLKIFS